MSVTENYSVAGHRFSVTADEEYHRLMDNYEPFSITSRDAIREKAFTLTIGTYVLPDYTEELRQEDGAQTIICGHTSDNSAVFVFQWSGEMAGWLVSSEDYREGWLSVAGRYAKLAIDNALMILYAMSTAGESTVLIHAAATSHKGRGYLFLGPSGTGKSTHARLWLENIPGTELVNDDNPVVRVSSEGVAIVYGSPWSGKTSCYRNVSYPLGGIVLLSQAPLNKISRLGKIAAYAAIMSSVSGKRWDRGISDGQHATESILVSNVAVWHMWCLPDKEAARICESTITNMAGG